MRKRYLLVADVLLSTGSKPQDERWFPPQIALIGFIERLFNAVLALLGLQYRIRWSLKILAKFDIFSQLSFEKMIAKARELGPFDGIIGAGNYTIGVRESGMITPKCIKLSKLFLYKIGRVLTAHNHGKKRGRRKYWYWTPGGHDHGYRYNVRKRIGVGIGSETGGLSEQSILAFQEQYGPLFDAKDLGPARLIWLSSGLMRNVNEQSSSKLKQLKRKQYDFLRKCLEEFGSSKPVFIVMHDPTALPKMPEMTELLYKHRNKISAIIHGHSHAKFAATLTKITPSYYRLCRDFQVFPVPAPGGMFGFGKGFAVLSCSDNGSWEFQTADL